MCALKAGRSVESSMGFTALDGLPMGTRPGQIDPGVVLYLMSEKGVSAAAVQDFLYRECGLKGLSGISNDMRELEASDDPRAAFAIDYFVYRTSLFAGMLAAALQGVDALVFTAGVGENSRACSQGDRRASSPGSGFPSIRTPTRSTPRLISRPESRVAVYVLPTDEELMIAEHTWSLLSQKSDQLSGTREEGIMTIPVYPETKVALKGSQGADRRHRQRSVDCLGMRQGVPRLGRRSGRHLFERQRRRNMSSRWRASSKRPIFMPLDVGDSRTDGGGVRAN